MLFFEILHEPMGLWRIRRSDGLVEGCFLAREDAIRFARRQDPRGLASIVPRDVDAVRAASL